MKYHSHADIGGQLGAGRVVPEPEGELFHAEWEPKALALTLAMGATGVWNIDTSRSTREVFPNYSSLTYYQLWIAGLEKLLVTNDLVGADELTAGRMLHASRQIPRVLQADAVPAALAKGSPTERPAAKPARFSVGDRVRTRVSEVPHHTRLPGYARGKVGCVEAVRGAHVFADSNAQGLGEQPDWLYTVVFAGHVLWGNEATPDFRVSIDAWEPYLEPAA
jgi:nitrile hydratase